MFYGSDEFNSAIENTHGNAPKTRLKFADDEILDLVSSIRYYGGSNDSDDVSIGTTTMARVEVSAYTDKLLTNREFLLEQGIELANGVVEYMPIGYFTIQKPSGDIDQVTFTAYDRMQKFEKPYSSNLAYPTTSALILNELCQICGIELATTLDNAIEVTENLKGYTCREVLGYIASMHGYFACIDRYGRLNLRWYSNTPIEKSLKKVWHFEKSQDNFEIAKVEIAKDSETNYVSGSGITTLHNSNPLATQEITDSIFAKLGGFSYSVGEIEMLDDARLDPWDMVSVEYYDGKTYNIPCMTLEHDFKAYSTTVKSVGKSESENEYRFTGPTIQYLNRMAADLLVANRVIATKVDAEYVNSVAITTENFDAKVAEIKELVVDEIDGRYATIDFANIDIANINKANIGLLFAEVGLLDRATIVDGHVTGFLDAVEINANKITAGTLIADRILLSGEEGSVLYALNNLGELTSTNVDTLDGYILTDRTITADKIVAKSITTNELDVDKIFGNEAVLNKIVSQDIFANAISTNTLLVGAVNKSEEALNAVDNLSVGGTNLLIRTRTVGTYLNTSGGELKNPDATYSPTMTGDITSDWIDVSLYDNVTITLYDTFTNTTNIGRYCLYDSNKSVLSTTTYNPRTPQSIVVDTSNASYMRITAVSCLTYRYKVEKGNKATDWSPAPEDVEADIATANTNANTAISTANTASTNATNALNRATYHYGTCSTAAGTATKVVTLSGFELYTGAQVTVQFTNANTASNPTLNVNSTGAKNIRVNNANISAKYYWKANNTVTFVYNGTYWVMSDTSANTIIANWCSSNDVTYIDGGKIYTGSITADKIDVNDLFAQDITATGSITGATLVSLENNSSKVVIDKGEVAIYDFDTRGEGGFYKVGSVFASGGGMVSASGAWIFESLSTELGNDVDEMAARLNKITQRKFILIGDSYLAGQTPDGDIDSWGIYLKNLLPEYSFSIHAIKGSGFGNTTSGKNFLDALKKYTGDKSIITDIIVCGGFNDAHAAVTTSGVLTGIKNFVAYAESNFINAKIHIGYIGATTDGTLLELIKETIRIYRACGSKRCGYISNMEYTIKNTQFFTSDGVHPNQIGQKNIAWNIASYLTTGNVSVIQEKEICKIEEINTVVTGITLYTALNNSTASLYHPKTEQLTFTGLSATKMNGAEGSRITLGALTNSSIIGNQSLIIEYNENGTPISTTVVPIAQSTANASVSMPINVKTTSGWHTGIGTLEIISLNVLLRVNVLNGNNYLNEVVTDIIIPPFTATFDSLDV